jgi:integrase
MKQVIQDFFLEHAYSESTKVTYGRVLNEMLDAFGTFESVGPRQLNEWLENRENWGESMQWIAFSTAKKFVRWRYGEAHPALKLKRRRPQPSPQRTMDVEQVCELMSYFGSHPKGIRDKAIASLLLDSGIRSNELCNIRLRFFYFEDKTFEVKAKGGEWKTGVFGDMASDHIRDWLEIRDNHALPEVDRLFVGLGGIKPGTTLTPDGLRVIVRRWGRRAGIGQLSPHDFRRSFATLATMAKAPTRLVQLAGRWKNIEEVERYTKALRMQEFIPYSPLAYALSEQSV